MKYEVKTYPNMAGRCGAPRLQALCGAQMQCDDRCPHYERRQYVEIPDAHPTPVPAPELPKLRMSSFRGCMHQEFRQLSYRQTATAPDYNPIWETWFKCKDCNAEFILVEATGS